VLVFRRPDARATTKRLVLHGLDAKQKYRIDRFEVRGTEVSSGRSLMQQGLTFSLLDAPASAIVQYHRQA